MATVLDVTFQRATIKDQKVGGPDEYMIATVFGLAQVEGTPVPLSFDAKQTVGSSYGGDSVFEVTGTVKVGAFTLDHATVLREVAPFLQGQVGASGRGIMIMGGGQVTIKNSHFAVQPRSFKCPAEKETTGAGW